MLCLLLTPAHARTRPHYGGTLRVETAGDAWQRPDGLARRLVYDGLTVLDARGAVQPALATEWSADNDAHRWQFKLRAGVRWQDGTALTSVNVVAALNAVCAANCPWTAVRAVGSSVVFVGDAPMPNLPALLAGDEFLLALTVSAEGKPPEGNVGTGPFAVTGFQNGVLALKANETCWSGRPFADAVEVRVRRAVRDQWLDLSMGRADVVEVPVEALRQAQQQHLRLLVAQRASLLALQVNAAGALSNPQLRAALAAAVDRSALSNVVFQKQGEVTASLLPQALTGYGFLFSADRDLKHAHELRGGITSPMLGLRVEGDGAMQLAGQRIALDLSEAGFRVQTAAIGAKPDLTLRKLPLGANMPEAALDVLLRAAGEPAAKPDAGPAGLYKTEREELEQHTLVPLLDLPRAYAVGERVRDARLSADGTPDLAQMALEDAP